MSKIAAKRKSLAVSQRMGMLPSIGNWLLSRTRGEQPLVSYKTSSIIPKKLDLTGNIPDPLIFSDILKEYISLASYMPIYREPDSTIHADPNIDEFCSDLHNIEAKIEQMRAHVPLAVAVFNFYLKKLKDHKEQFLRKLAQEYKIYNNSDSSILYNGWSISEIKNAFFNMTDEELANLGDITGITTRRNILHKDDITSWTHIYYGRRQSDPEPRSVPEKRERYIYDVIELNPKLQEHYKDALRYHIQITHELFDCGPCIREDHQLRKVSTTSTREDTVARRRIENAMAYEILQTQDLISRKWAETLNINPPDYLENVYKARFVLETLLEGGYGSDYQYIKELSDISNTMTDANKAIQFIENNWQKGEGAFTRPENYKKNALENYFLKHNEFVQIQDTVHKSSYSQAIIPVYNLPASVQTFHQNDIGNLESARQSLKWAAQFADMKPINCT